MPRPPLDLNQKIVDLLSHVESLPPEASTPLGHYRRSTADVFNLLTYVKRHLSHPDLYAAVRDAHVRHLNSLALVSLIETFERFLKEIAAVCVDQVAPYVQDGRYNAFNVKGSGIAAHFRAQTVGKALCESNTWFDLDEVDKRFRQLLAEPYEDGNFHLFAKQPADEKKNRDTLNLIWQVRHAIVHNVGVITETDATKLALLSKRRVKPNVLLRPEFDDLRYVKRFLDETARRSNEKVGVRLADLMTTIHTENPSLYEPQEIADGLSTVFGIPVTVAGATGKQVAT